MVEFFSGYPGLNKSAMNKNKMTALDIIGKKQNWKNSENRNVEQYLKRAKARPAKEVLKHQADGTWLEEQRTSLMVVASLIATMAFQVGINPPGGVWQDTNVVKNKNGNIVVQEDGSNDSTHYAGHLKIIEALIVAKPNMCFAHDQEGRTPIFIAAVTGQIEALELLHRANPYATQGRTNDGESILHLCVKHNQLKSLQRLLELVDDDGNQLINFRDNDGNTILHLACNDW
uniref:PGG domain-containing protein n=1 Tax=Chenopodium quinoa TaxID=63459 RepID=A0A803LBL8_CHEQI